MQEHSILIQFIMHYLRKFLLSSVLSLKQLDKQEMKHDMYVLRDSTRIEKRWSTIFSAFFFLKFGQARIGIPSGTQGFFLAMLKEYSW